MMICKCRKGKYVSMGFVELIVAIAVAGIAVLVLMNMASNSVRESIRLERQDALNRLATAGALVVRKHAEDWNNSIKIPEAEVELFSGSFGSCYKVDFALGRVDFSQFLAINEENFDEIKFDVIKNDERFSSSVIYGYNGDVEENVLGDVYALAYCVNQLIEESDLHIYIGEIVVGYVNCSRCGVEPYLHPVIVNVFVKE